MRILVVRPWGKTAFELGGYCKNALEEIGHTADIFTYNDERISSRLPFVGNVERVLVEKLLLKKISNFEPRLILVVKGDRVPPEVIQKIKDKFKIPVANYWIDDPHAIEVSQKISPYYDYFFTNDPGCVRIHGDAGCPKVKFLSFGCVPSLHRKVQLSRKESQRYGSDVCFAGTVSDGRFKVLEALADLDLKVWSPRFIFSFKGKYKTEKKKVPASLYRKFTGRQVWGEELARVYNASRIVLNIHSPQTVPIMRDFEATGCRALLLTDNAGGLEAMFKPGEEIICYRGIKELVEKTGFYLSHPKEREEIAQRGQARAYRDHTYAHRMKELISFVGEKT